MNPISSAYLNPTSNTGVSGQNGGGTSQVGQGQSAQDLFQDIEALVEKIAGALTQGQQQAPAQNAGPQGFGGPQGGQGFGGPQSFGGPQGGQGFGGPQAFGGQQAQGFGAQQAQGPVPNNSGTPNASDDGLGSGQGLRDVKLNTAAGGEALHLKEDGQGNLYNNSGNSVGTISQDGSVTLNSGATQERQRLETGNNPFGIPNGKALGDKGNDGSVTFNASQVTVSAGDLNQKNDF